MKMDFIILNNSEKFQLQKGMTIPIRLSGFHVHYPIIDQSAIIEKTMEHDEFVMLIEDGFIKIKR